MSIDLEYAIKQDVRNNPVVREVDRDQKKEFLRTLGWAALFVGMLMFALLPRTSLMVAGYRVGDLRERLAAEKISQRKYRLELEVLLRPQELQRRAIRELRMIEPNEHDTVVLERVPASPPASRAIVAAVR
jgi:hypothetical protein